MVSIVSPQYIILFFYLTIYSHKLYTSLALHHTVLLVVCKCLFSLWTELMHILWSSYQRLCVSISLKERYDCSIKHSWVTLIKHTPPPQSNMWQEVGRAFTLWYWDIRTACPLHSVKFPALVSEWRAQESVSDTDSKTTAQFTSCI